MLLGHSEPLVQKLGKRLYDLELKIHTNLEHIERLRSPSHADMYLSAHEELYPGQGFDPADKKVLLEGFRSSSETRQDKLLKQVLELSQECSRIRRWADDLEANMSEINQYLRQAR